MPESRQTNTMILMIDEVMRLNTRLRAVFAGAREPSGLSPMESMVLTAVTEAIAAPTVPKIGRSLGHARQVVQRAADSLIEQGLVFQGPNPDHKRAPLLLPTPKGERIKGDIDKRATAQADALLATLDPGKAERITGELRALRHEIEEHLRSRAA